MTSKFVFTLEARVWSSNLKGQREFDCVFEDVGSRDSQYLCLVGQGQVKPTGAGGNESSGLPDHAYVKEKQACQNYKARLAYYCAIHAVDTIFLQPGAGCARRQRVM